MIPLPPIRPPFLASAALAALLAGCITDQSKRGTIVDNEVRVGILYLADGRTPAAHARVRAYPVGFQPDTSASGDPAYATYTDAKGGYSIALEKGEYNILGEKDGAYSYQDSVFFGAGSGDLQPDTLSRPGSVAGVVGLQPNHTPISCLVQVLGTQTYSNVDALGRFRLHNLAEGRYTLRIYTTFSEYTALIHPIRVVSGRDDTLPDTLRLPYAGIPVVAGLAAAYDTAAAVVKLAWTPAQYRDFSEYLVYRDDKGVLVPSSTPIGSTRSPAFADTLLGKEYGFPLPGDTSSLHFEYRVRVRNKSDQTGLSYGRMEVDAVGPGRLRVRDSLRVKSVRWDSSQRADHVVVAARLESPKRGIRSVRWSLGPADSLLASHDLGGVLRAEDTVAFDRHAEGPVMVRIRIEDSEGTLYADSLLHAGNSAPKQRISILPEYPLVAHSGESVDLGIEDPDGDSLRYSLRNNPSWLTIGPDGRLRHAAANADTGLYSGIKVSVTDGRRSVEIPPFAIRVKATPWISRKPVPTVWTASAAVTLGSRIFLFTPGKEVNIYTPATDSWAAGIPMPVILGGFCAHAVDGKIYVIGGYRSGGTPIPMASVWAFDTSSGTWAERAPMPTARYNATSAVLGGKIYVIGGEVGTWPVSPAVEEYNPVLDAWTRKKDMAYRTDDGFGGGLFGGRGVALDGRIYVVGSDDGNIGMSTDRLVAYDPVADAWEQRASLAAARSRLGAAVIDGRLYAGGGYSTGTLMDNMDAYDPVADAWTPRTPMPRPRLNPVCAAFGGRMYFFQGQIGNEYTATVDSYDPAWDPLAPAAP